MGPGRAQPHLPAEPETSDFLAPKGGGRHDPGMEARLAVLEEIAASTKDVLREMRADLKVVREKQETDYRSLYAVGVTAALGLATLSFMLAGGLAGIMAKGFTGSNESVRSPTLSPSRMSLVNGF
jgi:hypothetical protein